jgi:hypothetical protein
MELQMVIQYREVDMIQLEEMLQASTSFVRSSLAIVDLHGSYFDGSSRLCCSSKAELGNTKSNK